MLVILLCSFWKKNNFLYFQLAYCVVQFLEKDSSLTEPVRFTALATAPFPVIIINISFRFFLYEFFIHVELEHNK